MSSAIDFVVTTAGARAAFSANAAGLKLDLVAVAFGGGKAQAPASDAEIGLENELGRIDSRELAEGEIFSGVQSADGNLTLTIVKPALAAGSAQILVSELGLIAVDPDTGGEVLFAVWRDSSPLIAFSDLVAFRLSTVLTLAGLPSGSINITLDANFLEGRVVSLEQSAVRFDGDQGLTPGQQLQGRTNIDAASQADLDGLKAVRYDKAQGLTANQKQRARSNIGAADQAAIDAAIDALVDNAPGALDTLKELAGALGDNEDALASLIAQLALKADKVREVIGSGLVTGGGDLSANRVLEVKAASDAQASAMIDRKVALVPGNLGAIAAAFITSKAFAAPGQYWEYKTSGVWAKPANVNPGALVIVHLVGGGAGGYPGGASGGGGGGGYLLTRRAADLPSSNAIVAGAGGFPTYGQTQGGHSSFNNIKAGGGGASGKGGGFLGLVGAEAGTRDTHYGFGGESTMISGGGGGSGPTHQGGPGGDSLYGGGGGGGASGPYGNDGAGGISATAGDGGRTAPGRFPGGGGAPGHKGANGVVRIWIVG